MGKNRKKGITGMHLVVDGDYVKVKKKKIKSSNIRPKTVIRLGVIEPAQFKKCPECEGAGCEACEEGLVLSVPERVKLVKSTTIPIFREDNWIKLLKMAEDAGMTAKTFFKIPALPEDADEEAREVYSENLADAESRFHGFIKAILAGAQELPLQTYKKAYVDVNGTICEKPLKYQVKDVVDGVEQLEEFPYLETTNLFPISDRTVQPRIYWDELLREGDKLYEVFAPDDVGRFALWDITQRMNAWEYEEGHPKHGQPPEEVMAVVEGVHLTGGTTQEYIALIAPKRIIQPDGSEKFVLVMKACQSNIAYVNAMEAPKPGERPQTVQVEQKPLVMASFAELIQQVKA